MGCILNSPLSFLHCLLWVSIIYDMCVFLGFLLDSHIYWNSFPVFWVKLHLPLSNLINLREILPVPVGYFFILYALPALAFHVESSLSLSVVYWDHYYYYGFHYSFFFFFFLLWTSCGQIFYFLASTLHYMCSYPHLLINFFCVPKGSRDKICLSKYLLCMWVIWSGKWSKPQKTQEASLTSPLNCLKNVGSGHSQKGSCQHR